MDGQECHLLGLRDFTDIKSLAGDNAADAIREGHSPHDDDWPPPTLGELDISGNADSRLSYQLGNFSSDASEASNETLEQHNHSNGIVEKRLMYLWQHEVCPDLPALCDCCTSMHVNWLPSDVIPPMQLHVCKITGQITRHWHSGALLGTLKKMLFCKLTWRRRRWTLPPHLSRTSSESPSVTASGKATNSPESDASEIPNNHRLESFGCIKPYN